MGWKKEYSTSYLRSIGYRLFKIISTDPLYYFGQLQSTFFTNDIQRMITRTKYDLSKIKIEDESGIEVAIQALNTSKNEHGK